MVMITLLVILITSLQVEIKKLTLGQVQKYLSKCMMSSQMFL